MPDITEEELKELLAEAFMAGWYESRYSPNIYGTAQRYAREAIQDLKEEE